MRVAIVLTVAFLLSGCGVWERFIGSATGYSAICINGVTYYQFTSGAAVGYNANGTVRTCK